MRKKVRCNMQFYTWRPMERQNVLADKLNLKYYKNEEKLILRV